MAILNMYSWDYSTSLSIPGIGSNAAASIVTTPVRTGPNSARCITAGIAGDTHGWIGVPVSPTRTKMWAQAAYLADAMPTTFPDSLCWGGGVFNFVHDTTIQITVGFNPTSGAMEAYKGRTTLLASSAQVNLLTPGTWNSCTVYVEIDSVNGRVIATWNGVEQINFTGNTDNGADHIDYIYMTQNNAGPGKSTYYDDVMIGDDSGPDNIVPPGDCRVEYIVPNGTGIATQFTPSVGSNWSNVDEKSSPVDTDYNASSTPGAVDLFTMEELSTAGLVYAVQTIARARKDDAGIRAIEPVIYMSSGAGETPRTYTRTSTALSDSFSYANNIFQVSPDTGVAWTVDEINAMQYGYSVAGAKRFTADAWMKAF